MVLPERSLKTWMVLVRLHDVVTFWAADIPFVNPRTGQKDRREVDDKMERGGVDQQKGSIVGLETNFERERYALDYTQVELSILNVLFVS